MTTGYPAVRDKCRDLGIVHDDWQQGLGRLMLGKRADGKYAATVGGVVLSIPRQVGKTFMVGTTIVALCLLFPGLTVLWTAHRTRTSNETFQKMKGMTARTKVRPFMLPPRSVNGEQEIRFRNGSRIMFGAREAGFGRGFDEVDVEVFDEAQILTEKALEDMVAATNQSRHPAGALLFYMGTPPRPIDPGEVFANKRSKALANKAKDVGGGFGDVVYVEFSADSDADPDDQEQWSLANPSFPDRTPVESMLRLRENVGSDESFLREGLGIWDADETGAAVAAAPWAATADPSFRPFDALAFAVESDVLGNWSSIGVAGPYCTCAPPAEPCSHGELLFADVIDHAPDSGWVVPRCVQLAEKYGRSLPFVVDRTGPAAHLIPGLKDAGLNVIEIGSTEVARSYSALREALKDATMRHGVNETLEEARRTARTRRCGGDGGLALGRVASGSDISPLVALSFAYWAARTALKPPPEVWSIRQMVAQIQAERTGNQPEQTQNPPSASDGGFTRPDGVTFTPL